MTGKTFDWLHSCFFDEHLKLDSAYNIQAESDSHFIVWKNTFSTSFSLLLYMLRWFLHVIKHFQSIVTWSYSKHSNLFYDLWKLIRFWTVLIWWLNRLVKDIVMTDVVLLHSNQTEIDVMNKSYFVIEFFFGYMFPVIFKETW